jgi:hypothetical protein
LKRKREEIEPAGNLEILAEAVTSQQDQSQNVLPASTRGKEVLQEGVISNSRDLGVSLDFDSTLGASLGPHIFNQTLSSPFMASAPPIFTNAGPSLPSFPPNFASLSFFSMTSANQTAVGLESENIFNFAPTPPKKSKVEKDVSRTRKDMRKIFEALTINNNILTYNMGENKILRTWLVNEFCPTMRVAPPPENPDIPPSIELPSFDHSSSFDDSTHSAPQ